MRDITREQYVGQQRELDLAVEAGGLPSYSEAILSIRPSPMTW